MLKKGWHGGREKRRSPRHDRKFRVILEYGGENYEIRTADISKHGALLPRRNPPSIGSNVKLTITIRNETSIFEGIVVRHTNCLVNGVKSTAIGIDIISPGYYEFVIDKIIIA